MSARSTREFSMLVVEDVGCGMARLELSKRLTRSEAEHIVGILEGHYLDQTHRQRPDRTEQNASATPLTLGKAPR